MFTFLDKQLSTPPLNGLILPGITRCSILELASQWEDLTVKEETISMDRVIQLNKEGRVSHLNTYNYFTLLNKVNM